jgi:hypothetical protein
MSGNGRELADIQRIYKKKKKKKLGINIQCMIFLMISLHFLMKKYIKIHSNLPPQKKNSFSIHPNSKKIHPNSKKILIITHTSI